MQAKKKFVALNNPAKEILFSLSGFGPNILMVLMGAYFLNAVDPSALDLTIHRNVVQTISGTCLILPWLFSILWFIAKCFDGIIDLPLAGLTDSLKSKFGKRRTPIAICTIPMIISYALCWYPISTNVVANSFWFFAWALTFFATYTMNLIAFYGSLSTTCADDRQRIRVSSLKSVFDTISYAIVYALVPLILDKANIHIDKFVFMCLPLMLTIIIPLFLIKEGTRWEAKAIAQGYDISLIADEKPVGFKESIKLSFKNKPFMKWVLVNCCSFFGLQLFLVSMNALILGGMGLTSTHMTILNTFAFAPVPVMLHLFNKVKQRKGLRFAYQSALLAFAIAIMAFFLGNKMFMGNNTTAKLIIGSVGGIIGSYAIGSFFMMTYMVPTQISSVEEKLTNKNHSAMYFATQALFSSIAGAIATGLVWGSIKGLFFSTEVVGIVKADSLEKAISILKPLHDSSVHNLGNILVPILVSVFCMGGFCFAFLLPREFTGSHLAKPLKLEKQYQAKKELFVVNKYPFDAEPLYIDIGLWVLSGSLFQYLWFVWLIDDINTFDKKKMSKWHALGTLIPFYAAYVNYALNKKVVNKLKQLGIKKKELPALYIVLSCLGLSVVCEIIIQKRLNVIAKKQKARRVVV